MKIVNFDLLKEVVSELEKYSAVNNPYTEEEKIIAAERIYQDFEDGKSRIPEYRRQLIKNTITMGKLTNKFENFVNGLDSEINDINTYGEDQVYFLYTVYHSTSLMVGQQMKLNKLGKELDSLMAEFNKLKNSGIPGIFSTENSKILVNSIKEKTNEITEAVKENHILKIMHAYYDRLSYDFVKGK